MGIRIQFALAVCCYVDIFFLFALRVRSMQRARIQPGRCLLCSIDIYKYNIHIEPHRSSASYGCVRIENRYTQAHPKHRNSNGDMCINNGQRNKFDIAPANARAHVWLEWNNVITITSLISINKYDTCIYSYRSV